MTETVSDRLKAFAEHLLPAGGDYASEIELLHETVW